VKIRCPFCEREIDIPGVGEYACPACERRFRVDPESEVPDSEPRDAEKAGTEAQALEISPGEPPPSGALCARHPEREAVDVCSRCGDFICSLCSTPFAQKRFCPDCIDKAREQARYSPWERRRKLGFVKGILETCKLVVLKPQNFFRRMPRTGGLSDPLFFTIILGVFSIMVGILQNLAIAVAGGETGFPEEFGSLHALGTGIAFVLITGLFGLVCGPIFFAIDTLIWSACLHLGTLMLGAKRGFETSFRIACYNIVTKALSPLNLALSLIGIALGLVIGGAAGVQVGAQIGAGLAGLPIVFYAAVVYTIAIQEVHGLSPGRAILAFATTILFYFLFFCSIGAVATFALLGGLLLGTR
jgi:hypothetical protein